MKTLVRLVVVLILAAFVGVAWAWIGRTSWAGTLDPATAGEQFALTIEPLRMAAGSLLIAVPAVLLIRSGWAWFAEIVLGRAPRERIRTSR